MKPTEETWEADLDRWEVRTPHVCDPDECRDGYHYTYNEKRLETDGGMYVNRDAARLHLIAAAPELYRALDLLLTAGDGDDKTIAVCEAALAKALGEAK